MKRTLPLCSLIFLFLCVGAHAQLYKWVGPDGKVSYSDTPPPPSAKRLETKSLSSGETDTSGFPYELTTAVKNHPVTLYTTSNCIPCEDGRKLLNERGIPFSEKTVITNNDIAALKKISGDGQLPLLAVGRSTERGFEATMWNTALTAAGYPETSKLPKNYRNQPAEAAAGKTVKPQAPQQANSGVPQANATADAPLPAIGNAPPGFRF